MSALRKLKFSHSLTAKVSDSYLSWYNYRFLLVNSPLKSQRAPLTLFEARVRDRTLPVDA